VHGTDKREEEKMMSVTAIRGAVVWMVMLLGALTMWTALSAHAAESPLKGTLIVPSTNAHGIAKGTLAVIAAGAAEDTLTACTARFPEAASAGQRMLAEHSCAGEEKTRNAIPSATKF
jgi:hypothetical protein